MVETWRTRLKKAIADKQLSKRGVSTAAAMSPGYIHGILEEGKEPTVENLLAVCRSSGISPAFVILGYEVPSDAPELFDLWAKASPATREGILQILAEHKAA